MKRWVTVLLVVAVAGMAGAQDAPKRALTKEQFLDKCKGAWAGQMIGVCYGDRYEFKSNGKIIEGEVAAWDPARVKNALMQDDVYVEMTFLKALEDYGLDVTREEAGKAFGASEYKLWHANRVGRDNVRKGIMPPLSGHPDYNPHADDIDFQIEADLFGIICPGLPHESNRLGAIFGSIMNYGDGVYGGLFVSGMYAAAYFENEDVEKVVRAGLACIPEGSEYHACVSDLLAWHAENPNDWKAAWQKLEDKYQIDDKDCVPGDPVNIDAKLNGAYIVMGLLYGDGDFYKTMEISTRCGQDADCNPSSAAGILGCMRGYAALGDATSGIPAMADENFSYTAYSFNSLVPACQRIAESIVAAAGGEVTADAYAIPVQEPKAPATLEQWLDQ